VPDHAAEGGMTFQRQEQLYHHYFLPPVLQSNSKQREQGITLEMSCAISLTQTEDWIAYLLSVLAVAGAD
jgi:hypothetical protein